MAITQLTGQDLIDLTKARLGGYQNSLDTDVLMSHINEGKDEVWALLKSLDDQYFVVRSQATVAANDYYFAPLTTGAREYTLPSDFREVKLIEVTTSGYTDVRFVYRDAHHPDFAEARRGANYSNAANGSCGIYYYTIYGKSTFALANYPEAAMTLVLWYVRALADYEAADTVDEILFSFAKKIAEYAAMKVMLVQQDQSQFEEWQKVWRQDVLSVATAANHRNQSDIVCAQEFEG